MTATPSSINPLDDAVSKLRTALRMRLEAKSTNRAMQQQSPPHSMVRMQPLRLVTILAVMTQESVCDLDFKNTPPGKRDEFGL